MLWRWYCKILGTAEVDAKGDNTGRYKVLEGYADMFPNLNIVGTFTDTITYNEPNCSGINSILNTNILQPFIWQLEIKRPMTFIQIVIGQLRMYLHSLAWNQQ